LGKAKTYRLISEKHGFSSRCTFGAYANHESLVDANIQKILEELVECVIGVTHDQDLDIREQEEILGDDGADEGLARSYR
jgi:hypothetical protein